MNGSMWCGPHPPASAAAAHTGVLILIEGVGGHKIKLSFMICCNFSGVVEAQEVERVHQSVHLLLSMWPQIVPNGLCA